MKINKLKLILSFIFTCTLVLCLILGISLANEKSKPVSAASGYTQTTEQSETVYTGGDYVTETETEWGGFISNKIGASNAVSFMFRQNSNWNKDVTANLSFVLISGNKKILFKIQPYFKAIAVLYCDSLTDRNPQQIGEVNYLSDADGWNTNYNNYWYQIKLTYTHGCINITINGNTINCPNVLDFSFDSNVYAKITSWGCKPSIKNFSIAYNSVYYNSQGFAKTADGNSEVWYNTASTYNGQANILKTNITTCTSTQLSVKIKLNSYVSGMGDPNVHVYIKSGNNIVAFACYPTWGNNLRLKKSTDGGTNYIELSANTATISTNTWISVKLGFSPNSNSVSYTFNNGTTTSVDAGFSLKDAEIYFSSYAVTAYVKDVVVDMNHTFSSICTSKCEHCSKTITSMHTYTSTQSGTSCTGWGKSTYTCNCGNTNIKSDIKALGHTPSSTATWDANHTKATVKCTRNGCSQTWSGTATKTTTTTATCTTKEAYNHTATFSVNGTSKTFTCSSGHTGSVNASNHTGSSVNGGTSGVHTKYSCCGATISTEHSYTKTTQTAATCTTKGTSKYTCGCGYSYTSQDIAMIAHTFTKQTATQTYLKSEATCTAAAVYYKSCTACGLSSKGQTGEATFSSGNALGHNWSQTYDATKHWEECSRCNATQNSANHGSWKYASTSNTQHKKTCGRCSYNVIESHSGWKNYTTTGSTQHNKTCGLCSNVVTENHAFTNSCDTSCDSCGQERQITHTYTNVCDASCNVCNATRTAPHSYSSEYSTNSTNHWYECTICGTKKSNAVHGYDNACDTDCNTCGYTRVTNHVYDNSCDTTCNTCGNIREITHTWKNTKDYNETNHWIECSICQEKKDLSNHVYDNNCDSSCNGCDYTRSITHNYVGEYEYNNNEHWQNCDVCGDNGNIEAHIFGEWVIISRPTQSTTGTERRTCSTCGYYQEQELTASNSASLTLTGDIGVNLYIDVLKYTEDLDAYVELTYNHNSLGYNPAISTDRISVRDLTQESDKTYKFSINYASGQINDKIFLVLYNSNGQKLYSLEDYYQNGYSIKDYCDEIINDESQPLELRNLCKSIINYGMRAIDYFDYDASLENSTSSYIETIEGAPTEITSVPEVSITEGARYLTISRFSFVALSEVSIRVYLDTSGFIFDASYTVECSRDYKTGYNDYGYYVEVYGIESAKIDELFTISIYFNGDQQNKTIIEYSALNYIAEKYEDVNSSKELKDLCIAINQYNYCAKAYFKYGSPWEAF